MNQDLYDACEFAKYAADMTIPVEEKQGVTPEAGSQLVAGMTNNAGFNPASAGAQSLIDPSGASELAAMKQQAALAAAKTASVEDAYYMGMEYGAYDAYQEKIASMIDEAYAYGYEDAMMEKEAATALEQAKANRRAPIPPRKKAVPELTLKEKLFARGRNARRIAGEVVSDAVSRGKLRHPMLTAAIGTAAAGTAAGAISGAGAAVKRYRDSRTFTGRAMGAGRNAMALVRKNPRAALAGALLAGTAAAGAGYAATR